MGRPVQLDALPPLRPAACFCARLPPLPLPLDLLLWLEPDDLPPPEFLPPFLDAALSEPEFAFEIAAARPLLIPFLRRPSYFLSFFTLDPWSLAMTKSLHPETACSLPRLPGFPGLNAERRRKGVGLRSSTATGTRRSPGGTSRRAAGSAGRRRWERRTRGRSGCPRSGVHRVASA